MHPFDHQSPLGTITFKARWLFTELGVSAALGPVPKGYHSFSLYHLYHLHCAMVNTYRDFWLLKPCFSQLSLFVCISWFFFFGFFMCSSWESCCATPPAGPGPGLWWCPVSLAPEEPSSGHTGTWW